MHDHEAEHSSHGLTTSFMVLVFRASTAMSLPFGILAAAFGSDAPS